MNAKTIFFLTVTLSFSAFAQDDMTAPMIERLRTRLRGMEVDHTYNPYDNRYGWIRHFYCDEGGIPLDTYHNEIIFAMAEHDLQGFISRSMLSLMRESKDMRFLPFIEDAAKASRDVDVRVSTIRAYVELCGFDSFPFLKKALAVDPDEYFRYKKLVSMHFALTLWTPTQEQIKNLCRFMLELAADEKDAKALLMYDGYLLGYLPEYKNSRQRLELINRANVKDFSEEPAEHFAQAKSEMAAIPPSELTDLRDTNPDLLPPEPAATTTTETAHGTGFRDIWLAVIVTLAALVTATLTLRKTKN